MIHKTSCGAVDLTEVYFISSPIDRGGRYEFSIYFKTGLIRSVISKGYCDIVDEYDDIVFQWKEVYCRRIK